jgi:hypothetical protein
MRSLCSDAGLNIGDKFNYAHRSANDTFPVNPKVSQFTDDWYLLLIDQVERKIYVFKIPANSLSASQITKRHGTYPDLFVVNFRYSDSTFKETYSGVEFAQWLVKTLEY